MHAMNQNANASESTPPPVSVVELLRKMVSFDTVNSAISGKPHAEAALAIYLETFAQNCGWSTRRLPFGEGDFNLLICHEVEKTQPWILFESHMDVVSTQGMSIEPFAAKIEGGKMFGRGACDTKASGAAMLCGAMSAGGVGAVNLPISSRISAFLSLKWL